MTLVIFIFNVKRLSGGMFIDRRASSSLGQMSDLEVPVFQVPFPLAGTSSVEADRDLKCPFSGSRFDLENFFFKRCW
jgi:hypothetical protein